MEFGTKRKSSNDSTKPILKRTRQEKNPGVLDHATPGLDEGLKGKGRQIIQVAAASPRGSFNQYVLPTVPIQPGASRITGITCTDGQLFYNDKEVDGLPIRQALHAFFSFLGNQPVVLVGHNIKRFDWPVIEEAAKNCDLKEELKKRVAGCIDTWHLFRGEYKGLPSYKQADLYEHFLEKENFGAHNAMNDVVALQSLLCKACPDKDTRMKYFLKYEDMRKKKMNY